MQIPINSPEFFSVTGSLGLHDILQLGIMPCEANGAFLQKGIQTLQKFCKENPQYHIISVQQNKPIVNRYLENSHHYYLANGNADPRLVGIWSEEDSVDLRRTPDGGVDVYHEGKKVGGF